MNFVTLCNSFDFSLFCSTKIFLTRIYYIKMRKMEKAKGQMLQGRSSWMKGERSHSDQLTGVTLGLHFHVQFRVNECHTKVAESWQYVSRRFRTVKQAHQGVTRFNPSMLCNSPIISIYLYTKLYSCNAMGVYESSDWCYTWKTKVLKCSDSTIMACCHYH
jgi:hypothetical protein